MRVGFIDSGYGGLLLASSVKKKFPFLEIIYIGDTKNMPYGEKEINFLNSRYDTMQDFAKKLNLDLLVVACNTLSATSFLSQKKKVETIDIISLSVDYLNKKNLYELTIIATPNTINSKVYRNNLNKDILLHEIPTKNLAPLIEKNDLIEANKEFESMVGDCRNHILLGCTHYSILKSKHPQLKIFSQDDILIEYLNKIILGLIDNSLNNRIKLFVNSDLEKYNKFSQDLFGKENFELNLTDF